MKNFLKMFTIIIMAFFLLAVGFYYTLTNVSQLLAAGKPYLKCQWLPTGLQIKTGKWCETINIRPPFKVWYKSHIWVIQSPKATITVNTKPKLRIQWKKNARRKEIPVKW